MQLDERKNKILQAVIKNYLETGEPVGSRTISKYADLDLSPATIRNEMSDLEEMGYIFQPHTSAGRIPTDAGYRLYVDAMLEEKQEEKKESHSQLKDVMSKRIDRIENVLKDMAKMLAHNTNYTSIVSMPQTNKNKLKFVQLTQVEEHKLLNTVVLEGNIVKNHMLNVKKKLDQQAVLKLNLLLNSTLNGLSLQEINFEMAAKCAEQAGEYADIVTDIINEIAGTIGGADGMEIFTSGAKNIFNYPELADSERAGELISTLEEKELLTELLADKDDPEKAGNSGIQVYIGDESQVNSMKDCSVITATYEFEDGVRGRIGILGPKRMDYEKVVDVLQNVTRNLDKTLSKDTNK